MLAVDKVRNRFIYPSQNVTQGSNVANVTFKIPLDGDLFASTKSALAIPLLSNSGGLAMPNLNGLLGMISGVNIIIGGSSIDATTDIGKYLVTNLRTRVGNCYLNDVVKYQTGMNCTQQLQQTVAADFKSITSSNFQALIDPNLIIYDTQTNKSFTALIPLNYIHSYFSNPIPLFKLTQVEIIIEISFDLTFANSFIPLAANSATSVTLGTPYIFSTVYTYTPESKAKLMQTDLQQRYSAVNRTFMPLSVPVTQASFNIAINRQKLQRLFIMYNQDVTNTLLGNISSKFDNSDVVPTVNILVNNKLAFNIAVSTDARALIYANRASVQGYTCPLGSYDSCKKLAMQSAVVDGTNENYRTKCGGNLNVFIHNFGPLSISSGAANNFMFVGDYPLQVSLMQQNGGNLATGTVYYYVETERMITYLNGRVVVSV